MTRYMRIKSMLTEEAANLKAANSSDKTLIRTALNDYTDFLIKEYQLSTFDQNRLVNYCCHLHPK